MSSRDEALRTLGLSRGADVAQVKAAFRRLAKQHHPDFGGSAADFQRVQEAHELLLDGEPPPAVEPLGPAIRARWNIRRRHQPSEYPPWFKPSDPGSRGLHTLAPLAMLRVRRPPLGAALDGLRTRVHVVCRRWGWLAAGRFRMRRP